MKCTRNVTDHVIWVGANDRRLNLFENLFPIPRGVSYNAYLIKDEKNALMDTVDASASEQFIENVAYALNGGKLDYLVVQHMEPDHCANIQRILELYPETKVVGNVKTMQMISQFFEISGIFFLHSLRPTVVVSKELFNFVQFTFLNIRAERLL